MVKKADLRRSSEDEKLLLVSNKKWNQAIQWHRELCDLVMELGELR